MFNRDRNHSRDYFNHRIMGKILNIVSFLFYTCIVVSLYIITYTFLQIMVKIIDFMEISPYIDIVEYIFICGWVFGMYLVNAKIMTHWKKEIKI